MSTIPPDESVDPPAAPRRPRLRLVEPRSRCRTPMPWTRRAGRRVLDGRPWLRLAPDAADAECGAAGRRPGLGPVDSIAACIALRAATPALQVGRSSLSFRRQPTTSSRSRARPATEIDPRRHQLRPRPGRVAAARRLRGEPAWRPLLADGAGRTRRGERSPAGDDARARARDEAVILEGVALSATTDGTHERPCYDDGRIQPDTPGSTTCRLIS